MRTSGTNISATGHKAGLGNVLYDKAGARPDLDLDFARTKSLKDKISKEDLITFTRSTTVSGSHTGATYVDEKGYINRAGSNLIKYSQDFSHSSWVKTGGSTFTGNNVVAPDGSLTAGTFSSDATGYGIIGANTSGVSSWIIDPTSSGSTDPIHGKWDDYLDSITEFKRLRHFAVTIPSDSNGYVSVFPFYNASSGSLYQTVAVIPNEQYILSFWTKKVGTKVYVWGVQFEPEINNPADAINYYIHSHPLHHKFHSEYVKTEAQASGAPRFTHDPVTKESKGLLIEQQATNLLTYSQDFSQSVWNKDQVSLDSNTTETTAPDGTNTATKLTATSDNNNHRIKVPNFSLGPNQYTYSIWVKAANAANHVLLKIYKGGNPASGNILYKRFKINSDGTTAIFGNDGTLTVEKYPNGWYRLIGTTKVDPQSHTFNSSIILNVLRQDAAGENFVGSGESVYVWGAQLEQNTFGTSYIPTAGSTVTRSPDLVKIEGDNFGTYRQNTLPNTQPYNVTYTTSSGSTYLADATRIRLDSYVAVSPDGNYNASLITENNENGVHELQNTPEIALLNDTTYTVSCHVKEPTNSRRYIGLAIHGRGIEIFDIQNGTHHRTTSSAGMVSRDITPVGNGWYRISMVCTTLSNQNATHRNHVYIILDNGGTNHQYQGDGVSGMYVWGVQVEQGNTLTPYIPSTDTYTNRQSNATYVDGDGLIKVALMNAVSNSEDLSSASFHVYNEGAVSANAGTSPYGNVSGAFIGQGTTGRTSLSIRPAAANNTFLLASNTQYVMSVFVKRLTGASAERYVNLETRYYSSWSTTGYTGTFDLETGTKISSDGPNITGSGIEDVGNGWYRLHIVATTSSTVNNTAGFYVNMATSTSTGAPHVTLTSSQGLLVWGAQAVKGTEVGDYYKTTGTPSGPPRYSHDPETLTPTGLYLEPAATNLSAPNVFDFAGAYGERSHFNSEVEQKAGQNTDGVVSPDGTAIGVGRWYYTGTETDPSVNVYAQPYDGSVNPNIATTFSNSNIHTSSVFIKPGLETEWKLRAHEDYASASAGGNPHHIICNYLLTGNGTISNLDSDAVGATVKKYPNGWYRCSITYYRNSTQSVTTNQAVRIYPAHYKNYNEKGITGNIGWLWGPQVEVGSTATSYIPTSGEEVNRTADIFDSTATEVLDRANGTKPAFYTKSGLTTFTEGIITRDSVARRFFEFGAPATTTTLATANTGTRAGIYQPTPSGSSAGGSAPGVNLSADGNKIAVRYAANNLRVCTDGTLGNLYAGVDTRSPTTLFIGRWYVSGNNNDDDRHLQGTINRLTIWKTPFTDNKLKRITS